MMTYGTNAFSVQKQYVMGLILNGKNSMGPLSLVLADNFAVMILNGLDWHYRLYYPCY